MTEDSLIYRFGESVKRIFFFSVFFLIMGWYQAPAQLPELGITNPWMRDHDLGLALAELAITAVIVTYFLNRYVSQLRQWNPKGFGRQPLSWRRLAVSGGGFLALAGLVYLATRPPLNGYAAVIRGQVHNIPITTWVGQLVAAPLIEELLYRGIFMNYFWNRDNPAFRVLTILSSAVIFGLLHEFSWSLALLFWCEVGFIQAGIYEYTRDLRYAWVVHIAINFWVVWLLL
ncbi:CPBP family intramembrane metalloprotease [Schleiferilactobacillus harbinensis]|uniref:Type II CAAX endopeptidase family protein n=2 Tax=Schleiferilactobacillus harbinensis TaxID=304207 RepID=A0ABU7SZ89_9LACO|nr:type II CAAX endopeptidase family protein [Schleiferilactobacillus harbinensis]KRM28109.1 hypothetical protein FC91_GL002200 [Schleiferilactobacillus harbinensis DSM 16991]MBO3093027.1 CPBP family intramembrane metalloprotease [Schleiferilactobacillus harbinensis]MCI1849460.1 CPBP family intramembrane metalloprotease [Schleiferilactobacillus harbinensis]QFR63611.1 CPBP family intramembrane metalloprotease [Schleiferilactobacillus harbinensis]